VVGGCILSLRILEQIQARNNVEASSITLKKMERYIVVMNGIALAMPWQVDPNDLKSVMKFVDTLKRDYAKSSLCVYEISRELIYYIKGNQFNV
jgi:hypothetical protein